MLVKTFEGMSIKEVVANIKKEFGRDAVILETREKTLPGGSQKMVEVKAAIPEAPKIHGAARSPGWLADPSPQDWEDRLGEFKGQMISQLQQIAQSMATLKDLRQVTDGLKDLKLLMVDSLRAQNHADYKNVPQHLEAIYEQLLITGLARPYLLELLNHLLSLPPYDAAGVTPGLSAPDFYRAEAMRYMLKKLPIYPAITPTKGHTMVHALVGPSGAGKTTTLVKLASYLQRKDKAKILFASYDPHRIAASESLRIYAKILDIPFLALEQPSDLEKALLRSRDTDIVLIDTYGRYPKNDGDLSDLKALKASPLPIDFHLVLALTEKDLQLDRAVSGFATLGIASLLFTKVDESWTYGDIYNLTSKWSLPLSFFSIGPNIPHDLEKSSRERVMERIFGL